MKRSDSSLRFRKQLAKNYDVPQIANFIPIEKYFSMARTLHEVALKAVAQGDLVLSYKYLHNFVTLVNDRIPTHNAYRLPAQLKNRIWSSRVLNSVMNILEEVVAKMDQLMDEQLQRQVDEELCDLFDGNGTGISVQPAAHPSTPDSTAILNGAIIAPQQIRGLSDACALLRDPEYNENTISANVEDELAPTEAMYPNVDSLHFINQNDRFCGVTVPDIEILKRIPDMYNFPIPPPYVSNIELKIGSHLYVFQDFDFHVTFNNFLKNLPMELQMARSAIEVNRCFFLHLGVAVNIHPFVLQVAFRNIAANKLKDIKEEDVQYELLSSVMEYAGLVDATALLYIWPTEIAIKYRLCIISGPDENPMFSTFSSSSQSANPFGVQDIIMRCQHSHFTLLKPLGDDGVGGGSMTTSRMVKDAEEQGLVVQNHKIDTCMTDRGEPLSIANTIHGIVGHL